MTGAVDPLFPLPDPGFIFVHQCTRYEQQTGDLSDGADPYTEEGWDDTDVETLPSDDTECYVSTPNYRDTQAGARIDAVVLVPRTFKVRRADIIRVPEQSGLYDVLPGTYKIEQVRPNPSHTRVLVARTTFGGELG